MFGAAVLVVSGALLATPALAGATQRYASVTGSGTACTSSAPCAIDVAINSGGMSDEVIVDPGTYTVGATPLFAQQGMNVHGVAGLAAPEIITTAGTGMGSTGPNVTFSDLHLTDTSTSSSQALGLDGTGTVGQRLVITSAGANACSLTNGALLRDTTCVDTKATSSALRVNAAGATSVTGRNLTVESTGTGSVGLLMLSFGAVDSLDLRNTILHGASTDIQASSPAMGTVTINLAYSNYATVATSMTGMMNITPVGSPTNQTTPPLFADTTTYHEATGSPTIDAGSADGQTGSQDVDGEARSQGASMDIGADELTVAAPPPPGDSTPPETTIDKGPKAKSTSKKATLTFSSSEAGSTFTCALDKAAAKPCTSPLKLKRLKKGKHTLTVLATDAAGNADASPATYGWKVKKKKRKR